jgi:hypothetical protein
VLFLHSPIVSVWLSYTKRVPGSDELKARSGC